VIAENTMVADSSDDDDDESCVGGGYGNKAGMIRMQDREEYLKSVSVCVFLLTYNQPAFSVLPCKYSKNSPPRNPPTTHRLSPSWSWS
jgi:hypothetical protein